MTYIDLVVLVSKLEVVNEGVLRDGVQENGITDPHIVLQNGQGSLV